MKTAEQIAAELEPFCLSEKAKQLLDELLAAIRGDRAFVEMTRSKKPYIET